MICRSIAEVLDLYERVRELERKHHKDLEEYSCIWPEVWFERADQQELRRRLEDLESLDSNRDLWIEGHKEECRC